MKVVRMIPSTNLSPPTYETWAINMFNYMNGLPGLVRHVVFDIHPGHVDFSRPSKGRYDSFGERRYISSLFQQLPLTHKAWLDYLSNDQNKLELPTLLIDYIVAGYYSFNWPVYMTKGNIMHINKLQWDSQ